MSRVMLRICMEFNNSIGIKNVKNAGEIKELLETVPISSLLGKNNLKLFTEFNGEKIEVTRSMEL